MIFQDSHCGNSVHGTRKNSCVCNAVPWGLFCCRAITPLPPQALTLMHPKLVINQSLQRLDLANSGPQVSSHRRATTLSGCEWTAGFNDLTQFLTELDFGRPWVTAMVFKWTIIWGHREHHPLAARFATLVLVEHKIYLQLTLQPTKWEVRHHYHNRDLLEYYPTQ